MASLLSWLKKEVKGGLQTVNRDIVRPVAHAASNVQHAAIAAPQMVNRDVVQPIRRNVVPALTSLPKAAIAAPVYFAKTDIVNPLKETSALLTGNNQAYLNAHRQSNIDLGLGATGTHIGDATRKLAGNSAQLALTAVAPGTESVISRGVNAVAPKIVPKIIPRVIKGAATGAVLGAPSNVATTIADPNVPLTRKNLTESARQGAEFGAILGGATPVAGAVAAKTIKSAVPAVKAGAKAAKNAEAKAFTPRVALNDQHTLTDLSDHLSGSKPLTGSALSSTLSKAQQIAQRHGVDITSGPAAARLDSVNRILDSVGQRAKAASQGGYVKNPFAGKSNAAIPAPNMPTLRPDAEQRVFAQNPMASDARAQLVPDPISSPDFSPSVPSRQHIAQPMLEKSEPRIQPPADRSIGQEPSQEPLPIYNTKTVPMRDKVFRSTRSIIERQGEHGKSLAGMLQGARDTEEVFQAQIAKRLATVRSLKGKDFENFVDATQGLAQARSPKIEQAVREWQAVHPEIRDRAVAAGLDVGDLGPKYYPHFIDYEKIFKNKNTYNEAINHLVKTGQAATQEDAIKLLGYARETSRNRAFGNLEASRQVDLPFYDKTPNSLTSYIGGSTKRIANTETFGKGDERALKLIAKAGVEGHDTEAMKNAFDVAVGAKRYGNTATQVSNKLRGYQSTTRLGLGALTNATQNVNTGIVTGHLRTLGAMLKQFDPNTRAFVEDTGTIADAVLNDLKTESGFVGKSLSKITAPGFARVEKFNRSVSATAGRDYALRLAQKGDQTTLRKLGVTGEIKGNTLTHEQQVQAARKVVEKTQFKVDPQDLPGWVDSPGGKLVAQFRTFSYSQGKFFANEILKPAAKGNLLPLGRLLAALPVGYGMYELKRKIAGRPEEESKARRGLEAFGNVGGAGLAIDIFRGLVPLNGKYLTPDRFTSMAAGTLGGPTLGAAVDASGAIVQTVQKKNLPSSKDDLAGKAAIVSGDGYYDATTAARFGLRQIPIAGTAIQNRVLPYAPKSTLTKDQQEQYDALPKEQQAAFKQKMEQLNTESKASTKAATVASFKGDTSGLSPVDALAAKKKQQQTALKGSLSPEDYKLSKLSKADRQKLIDQGVYTADKFTGLDNYVNNEKKKLGIQTSSTKLASNLDPNSKKILTKYNTMTATERTKLFSSQNDAEYQYAQARYNNDKASGTLSTVQDIRTRDALKKAKVGATFSKNIRDLYGLNKTELADYLTSDPNGNAQYAQLRAYDKALMDAGIIDKSKFKYGLQSAKTAKAAAKNNSYLGQLRYQIAIKPPKPPKSRKPKSAPTSRKLALKKFNPKKSQIAKSSRVTSHKVTA